jgi:hypothetical protein
LDFFQSSESQEDSLNALVGMLKRNIQFEKSATGIRLKKFGLALGVSSLYLSRADQLIFLCGANSSPGNPSARREAVKKFIENISTDYRVLYAEAVLNVLSKSRSNGNLLDAENEISYIADKIVIILESPSAFCELGAFAHPALRKKLIVINDSQFQHSSSFINLGPIKAASEVKSPVLWYPMGSDGVSTLDGIGAIFNDLKVAINPRPLSGLSKITNDISNLKPNKISLYFVHDLVLLTGPIGYKELIDVLIAGFGDKSYDMLRRILDVLIAAGLIQRYLIGEIYIFRAVNTELYLTYNSNIYSMMASFRRFHLEMSPKRFFNVCAS